MLRTTPRVTGWSVRAADPEKAQFAAAIVETRAHPHFEWVVKDVMHYLGPGWSLYVFYGTKNEQFVLGALDGADRVRFIQARWPGGDSIDSLNQQQYGRYLTTRTFWDTFAEPTRRVLIFQTDSCVLRPYTPDEATAWSALDYVGSPWHFAVAGMDGPDAPLRSFSSGVGPADRGLFARPIEVAEAARGGIERQLSEIRTVLRTLGDQGFKSPPPVHEAGLRFASARSPKPMYFAGNGGFSLRSLRATKEVLGCVRSADVASGDLHYEDQLFVRCLVKGRYRVARADEAAGFSVESTPLHHHRGVQEGAPFAMHQAYCFLPDREFAWMLVNSRLAADAGLCSASGDDARAVVDELLAAAREL